MTAERFMSLYPGLVGHVGRAPTIVIAVDLIENKALVVSGGKPLEWLPFSTWIMDARGMRTGDDIEKDIRGF